MIQAVIGLVLVITSILANSFLNSIENANFIRMKILGVAILTLSVGFFIQSILGLAVVLFKIDKAYHTIYGFSVIILIEIATCLGIILAVLSHAIKIRLSKGGFECLIYALVIALTVHQIQLSVYYDRMLTIAIVAGLTIVLLILGVLILKLHAKLEDLIEMVDTKTSLKVFTFACLLYGFTAIANNFPSLTKDVILLLLASHIALLISCLYLYRELYVKYLKPAYSLSIR